MIVTIPIRIARISSNHDINNFTVPMDLEKFTKENCNKISLVLNENSTLREDNLDNFILFIMEEFEDKNECLAKLKVLDVRRLNTKRESIFSTIMSIKGVKMHYNIERTSIYVMCNFSSKLFNFLVRVSFSDCCKVTRNFPREICKGIFKAKGIRIDKEEQSESETCISDENSEEPFMTDYQDIDGRFTFRYNKLNGNVKLDNLLLLLELVISKARERDFNYIVALLKLNNERSRKVVVKYVKNLDREVLGSLYFESLEKSNTLLIILADVSRILDPFNYDELFRRLEKRNNIDFGHFVQLRIPVDSILKILNVKKYKTLLIKQIMKLGLEDLKLLTEVEDKRIAKLVGRRIESLENLNR